MAVTGKRVILEVMDPLLQSYVRACTLLVQPGQPRAERIDITSLDTPPGQREYGLRRIDPGEGAFDMLFDVGTPIDALLRRLFRARTSTRCRITYPPQRGATRRHRVSFRAGLTSYEARSRDLSASSFLLAAASFAVSGDETWDTISIGPAGLVFVPGVFQPGVFR